MTATDDVITTDVELTSVSTSGGMIIQHYQLALDSERAGRLYEGTTYFGFFSDQALADQVGMRDAVIHQPSPAELERGTGFPVPRTRPFPDRRMRMVDDIELLVADGGPEDLGWIHGSIAVDADAWFFEAHFYQDPVWPGSLGLEAFLQLLKVYAARRWDLGEEAQFTSMPAAHKHRWSYRGQILPGCERVEVFASIHGGGRRATEPRRRRFPPGGRQDDLLHERLQSGGPRVKYSRVVIERFGYELAPCVVTSAELEEQLAPVYGSLHIQPGQLEQITGIRERRYWEPGYTVTQGATAAAAKVLTGSPVPSEALEMLIYGGVCREHFEPATACHVAAGLQRAGYSIHPSAHVYDVGNACLGVLNGMLDIANRIELGHIRAGMVFSCETARDIVKTTIARLNGAPDMKEFKTAVATLTGGSAAVAVILSDGSFGEAGRRRLRGAVVETAPEHHNLCRWGVEAHPAGQPPGAETSLREFASTDARAPCSITASRSGSAPGTCSFERWSGRSRTWIGSFAIRSDRRTAASC